MTTNKKLVKFTMLVIGLLLTLGCNVMTVHHADGGRFAILENPFLDKCVEVKIGDGQIEITGIAAWMVGLKLDGKDIHYRSWVEGCHETQ